MQMKQNEIERRVYNLTEVAAMFATSPRSVRRWVDKKEFPEPLKLPGPMRWAKSRIDRLIESQEASGGGK